jgi:hypothetical protein
LFDDEGFHGISDAQVERRHAGSFTLGETRVQQPPVYAEAAANPSRNYCTRLR